MPVSPLEQVDVAVAKERRLRSAAEQESQQLRRRLSAAHDAMAALRVELASADTRALERESELKRIRRSRDYRIGRAVLKAPRFVKRLLRQGS